MERISLRAEMRTEIGKGGARSLRRKGMLPAVIYSKGRSSSIKLQRKEIAKLLSSGIGEHTLMNIEISTGGASNSYGEGMTHNHYVLVKDYQVDPVTDEVLHVDFVEVSLKEKIRITVPIVITKEPAGIKKGGIMEHHLREVEIECLPTHIPDGIGIDAGFIEIGHSLHVSDIKPPEGVRIVTDPHEVILTVLEPKVEKVTAPEAEVEMKEPEVIKQKAKEEVGEKEQKETK
ncbi:MAG: 50S ribosomal protein L25 [Thermodesulfovibrionia bacterium]